MVHGGPRLYVRGGRLWAKGLRGGEVRGSRYSLGPPLRNPHIKKLHLKFWLGGAKKPVNQSNQGVI